MKNYKDRIKDLISKLYAPADVTNYDVKMTTTEVYANLCTIIPANAFDEFDVVEILEELNFFPGYEQKTLTIEKENGEKETKVFDDLVYFWYMKKIA